MAEIPEVLTRKVGPAPLWVYGGIGVLGLAWWLRVQQQKKAAAAQSDEDSGITPGGVLQDFMMAYPMPYQSDNFITITNPPNPITINNPPPAPGPVAPPPAPLPAPIPAPAPPPAQTSISYTIQRGDTLWGIATKLLGSGSRWSAIYTANKATIEAAARAHGYSSSQTGHWIFPGTRLVIPK